MYNVNSLNCPLVFCNSLLLLNNEWTGYVNDFPVLQRSIMCSLCSGTQVLLLFHKTQMIPVHGEVLHSLRCFVCFIIDFIIQVIL